MSILTIDTTGRAVLTVGAIINETCPQALRNLMLILPVALPRNSEIFRTMSSDADENFIDRRIALGRSGYPTC